MALYSENGEREPPPFSADDSIAEAGRAVMAAQLHDILAHHKLLRARADSVAVHETRKAVRRLSTAFKLFAPYFEAKPLNRYRRRFKKVRRRLGRSRDITVFLKKLDSFIAGAEAPAGKQAALEELQRYWQEQGAAADKALRDYVGRPKYRAFLDDFAHFTQTAGAAVLEPDKRLAPLKVRYLAPILIYERVAAVRAYEEHLEETSLEWLHQLRIGGKELRYTLQFFEPALGATAAEVIAAVAQIQEHLGGLNDASVALGMLEQTPDCEPGVELYRAAVEAEIDRLLKRFPSTWEQFNQPAWRQNLAAAVSVL